MLVSAGACVSVCVCVCAYVRVCAHADACVFWTLHVFAGVCLWKKLGRVRGGENVRVRYIHIFLLHFILFYCYFKCTFLSLEPMCQRKIFIFMLCILMNNKDLFDWFDLIYIILTNSEPATIFANRQYLWWHAWNIIATDRVTAYMVNGSCCSVHRFLTVVTTEKVILNSGQVMTVMHMIQSLDKMFLHGETKTLT